MPQILINDVSVIRRLKERGVGEDSPRYKKIFNAAWEVLRDELPGIVDECIDWAIKSPNLNRGELQEGWFVKFQGTLWEVVHVGASGAELEDQNSDKKIVIAVNAEVEVLKSPS